MSATDSAVPARPVRWGLAAKLFATLLLLGAVAVLITAMLGYIRARDALEAAIYKQLTAARQSKVRQIDVYFRTIRTDLHLLAASKMVVDAMRETNSSFDELDRNDVPSEMRRKVEDWYAANVVPDMRQRLGREPTPQEYLPVSAAAYYLQYHYIVANPYPVSQRDLLDDAGDGSRYSAVHALYHPLLREAAGTTGFWDFMLADAKHGHLVYGM